MAEASPEEAPAAPEVQKEENGEVEATESAEDVGASFIAKLPEVQELTDEALEEFRAAQEASAEEGAQHLAGALGYASYQTEARQSILLDFAIYVLQFARSLALTGPQTRRVFAVSHALLARVRDEAGESASAVRADLREALLPLVSAQPLKSDSHLSPEHVAALGRFLGGLLLQHFHLWRHALTAAQEHDHTQESVAVEVPVPPAGFAGVVVTEAEWEARREAERVAREQEATKRLLEEQEREREVERARQEEERARAEAELARLKELKPGSLAEAVELQVKVRVEEERLRLMGEFQQREEALRREIRRATMEMAGIEPEEGEGEGEGEAGAE